MINSGAILGVFGDVDNGKTTLLSKIFDKIFYEKEGITQKTRVLELNYKKSFFIFIDTPGHYGFSTTINKIIDVSDIYIIVIDILVGLSKNLILILKNILKKKKNSIFLINKIDKVSYIEKKYMIRKIKKDILGLGFLLEENGGENLLINISAKKKIGIEILLENIFLLSSILKKSDKDFGYVLKIKSSRYMKFSNILIIKNGSLNIKDNIYFRNKKVRITNIKRNGLFLKKISNYLTFEFLSDSLEFGEKFYLKKIKTKVKNKIDVLKKNVIFFKSFIFKTDCFSKYYAFKKIMLEFEDKINFLILDVGKLLLSDIKLSESLNQDIIFFSEKKCFNKFVLYFSNIYEIYNFLKKIYKKSKLLSQAKVVKIFKKNEKYFCGCKVLLGVLKNNKKVEIFSKKKISYSEILSLMIKKYKKDSVNEGEYCGVLLKNYKPIIGDLISVYE
ncbi:GTP-binding protein [Candidatus Vidania fulgoroideae]|nr:GTP-binding protein [Candidatus Vidania fulgoroideae]